MPRTTQEILDHADELAARFDLTTLDGMGGLQAALAATESIRRERTNPVLVNGRSVNHSSGDRVVVIRGGVAHHDHADAWVGVDAHAVAEPVNGVVGIEVAMGEVVSHTGDVTPGNVRFGGQQLGVYVFDGFANLNQPNSDSVEDKTNQTACLL